MADEATLQLVRQHMRSVRSPGHHDKVCPPSAWNTRSNVRVYKSWFTNGYDIAEHASVQTKTSALFDASHSKSAPLYTLHYSAAAALRESAYADEEHLRSE